MPSVVLILGIIVALLALISLIPQINGGPALAVAVLLAGIALVVLGYGGR